MTFEEALQRIKATTESCERRMISQKEHLMAQLDATSRRDPAMMRLQQAGMFGSDG
jgi:hypothetical protein